MQRIISERICLRGFSPFNKLYPKLNFEDMVSLKRVKIQYGVRHNKSNIVTLDPRMVEQQTQQFTQVDPRIVEQQTQQFTRANFSTNL